MKISTYTYTGNGQENYKELGFKPKGAIIAADAAVPVAMWHPEFWCNRGGVIDAVESTFDGPRPGDTGLYVGQHATSNTLSATHHALAFGLSQSSDFETGNYMGNLQSGRVVNLQSSATPIAVLVKRDSGRAPVLYANGLCVKLDGTGVSTAITSLGAGHFVVDASNEANEYNAAGGLGEGIEHFAFFSGGSVSVAAWAGGQAAGSLAYAAPGNIRGVILVDTLGASAAVTLTDTMVAGYGKSGSAALSANAATISGTQLLLGSGNVANQAGRSYVAVVFCDKDVSPSQLPTIVTKKKRAIYLPGRDIASYIGCGTSDSTLKINGALTLEWFGVPSFLVGVGGADACLMMRGGGSFQTAGSASWGLDIFGTPQASLHWQNSIVHVVTGDRFGASGSLETCAWRTGTLTPNNLPVHLVVTHNGLGLWKFFKNGKLVNQRNIDLTNTAISQGGLAIPNIASGAGHTTVFGARMGGALAAYLRCLFINARVYSRELTTSEAYQRFAIAALGSTQSDVSSAGLAESWDAANAGGTLLPASVNAANNGTIVNGSVVTL